MVIVDASTVRVEGQYTEPAVDADGGPIIDLAYTNVYYKIGSSPAVRGPQVPATSPAGGGVIDTTLLVPVAANQRVTIAFWVTATDLVGIESAPTQTINLTIDRVAPGAPTGFTIA